jgi:hypothetical protein
MKQGQTKSDEQVHVWISVMKCSVILLTHRGFSLQMQMYTMLCSIVSVNGIFHIHNFTANDELLSEIKETRAA